MITCQICQKQMKLLTKTHLKPHSITFEEYKIKFPDAPTCSKDLMETFSIRSQKSNESRKGVSRSKEEKENITKAIKKSYQEGREAHNKGVPMSEEQKKLLSEAGKERHKKWKEQGISYNGPLDENTKNKISQSLKERYLELGLDKIREQKAKERKEYFQNKKDEREKLYKLDLETKQEKANISILNKEGNFYYLECQKCLTNFERTIQYFHDKKFREDMCPKCREPITHSKPELEIYDFVKECLPNQKVRLGCRNKIWPLELDIFIEDMNIAIEFCGLYWHSEVVGKDRRYHLDKKEKCDNLGIRLITIFEDEWKSKKDIVESRLRNILNITPTKIGARKCDLKTITAKEANIFLNMNHIQEAGRASIHYGLFYQNELVSVMTFSKSNISRKNNEWEINRFANKLDVSVIGGASRLFQKVIKDENPEIIISYADSRWSEGNLYQKLGFTLSHQTPPNYWYFKTLERIHRFTLRKTKNDDQILTEWENRQLEGYNRIWDCGSTKWVFNK